MQLKEKLDFGFLRSKKQTMFKVAFSLILFLLVFGVSYFIMWLARFLNLFSAFYRIPLSFMAFVYFVIFVMNTITCTIGLSKTFYYSKDNQLLVTFPVNPNALFFSKLLVYFLSEIKKCFYFAVPIFWAYGFISSFSFVYFIWVTVMLVILSAIPVLIGAILSIPTNYVMAFFRRYPLFKVVGVIIVLGVFVFGATYVINLIPEDINLIKSWTAVSKALREFLSSFQGWCYPFYAISIFLCGKYEYLSATLFTEYSYIVLLCVIGVILVLVGLAYITSRPLYLHLITKEFEVSSKKNQKLRRNVARDSLLSVCLYETEKNVKNPSILSTSITTMVVAPIAVLLLNSIYLAINTRLVGDYLTISFNVLVVMIFVLSHNINLSSVYSRDGDALVINKTFPISPFKLLFPRLIYNFVISLIILTSSASIFFAFSTLSAGDCALLFFAMLFAMLIHMVWSAELDFVKPSYNVFKSQGGAGINPNEVKSSLLAFAISAIMFGLSFFFLMYTTKLVFVRVLMVVLFVLALRIYLYYTKTKTLFREM